MGEQSAIGPDRPQLIEDRVLQITPSRTRRNTKTKKQSGHENEDVVTPFPDLIQLGCDSSFYMNKGQTAVWQRTSGKDGEGKYRLFGPGGVPALLKCVCPRGRPQQEDAAPAEVLYYFEWRWPDGSKAGPEWYSAAAIRKGEYFDRFGIALAGKKKIDLWAEIVLAQRRVFPIVLEYPVRHSGFSAADETPAYILHDGRALGANGKTEPGTIAGDPPLMQRKRRDRWESRFQALPTSPPSEEQLDTAITALLKFDPKGRALCAAALGVRALFYSFVSMDVTVLESGMRGTAKTAIAQIMHWAEGPCAASDEPDMSFRTTFLGSELTGDRAHDCAFLIDDGERMRPNDPGAPLKQEVVRMISDQTREAFDGAPARVRGGKAYVLARQRKTQQLRVFSTETALGLEASVLARTIWWTFEKGEIALDPMLSADWRETATWIACQEVFTAIGHTMIRRVLEIWDFRGREAAVNFIRKIDRDASELAVMMELGGQVEDRPRIQRGLAMIVAAGILCDIAAGSEAKVRDLVLQYGAELSRGQLDRLASGATATVGFDFEWFRAAFEDLINGGEYLWLNAETGSFFKSSDPRDASHLMGIGYQWRSGSIQQDGWVPVAKIKGGWRNDAEQEYWAEPAQFFTYCERRVTRQGGTFPFSRQTLPDHLVKLGFTKPATDGRNTHKLYIPMSDARYPDKGSRVRVMLIPFEKAEIDVFERGQRGRGDLPNISNCNDCGNEVPARPLDLSPLSDSGDQMQLQAGTSESELNQIVTDKVPAVPAVPAEKEPFNAFCSQDEQVIENIGNGSEVPEEPAAPLGPGVGAGGEAAGGGPGGPLSDHYEDLERPSHRVRALAQEEPGGQDGDPSDVTAGGARQEAEHAAIPGGKPCRQCGGPTQRYGLPLGWRRPALTLVWYSAWDRCELCKQSWFDEAFRCTQEAPPTPPTASPGQEACAAASDHRQEVGTAAQEARAAVQEGKKPRQEPASSAPKPLGAPLAVGAASIVSEHAPPPGPASASGGAVSEPARVARREKKERRPERIAVLGLDELWLLEPDGAIERRPLDLSPEKACQGLLVALAVREGVTQVWLSAPYAAAAGLPHDLDDQAVRDGVKHRFAKFKGAPSDWKSDRPGCIKPWLNVRTGEDALAIVMPSLSPDPGFGSAKDAETMVRAIGKFRAATKFNYIANPAVVFFNMIRAMHRGPGTLDLTASLAPKDFPAVFGTDGAITRDIWVRPLTAEERSGGFIHVFDKNGMYLAAMSSLALGFGVPKHVPHPIQFDKKMVGYFKARITPPASWPATLPHPCFIKLDHDRGTHQWQASPALNFACEIGCKIDIVEAWVFPEKHRPLEPVYVGLRDARTALMEDADEECRIALTVVKQVYANGIGNLANTRHRQSAEMFNLQRPDWRHFIRSQARANLLRNIVKAGLRPFGIRTDAIYIVSTSSDPMVAAGALRIGKTLADWKHVKTLPLDLLPREFFDDRAAASPQRYLDAIKKIRI
jgi:hypothetical protein